MGIFDGIIGAVAGPVIGGLLGNQGAEQANEANILQSQANRDFQERMSSTAYQRATKDMMAAGLNPMLAYSQGGASTPTGGVGNPIVNKQAAGAEAAAKIAGTAAQIAQTKVLNETADKTKAETANVEADTALKNKQAWLTGAQDYELTARGNLHYQTMTQIDAQIGRLAEQNNLTRMEVEKVKEETLNAIATRGEINARTGNLKVDNVLKKLEIPVSEAIAKYYKTMGPTALGLKDVSSALGSALDLKNILRRSIKK